jgi:serine/threonine protein kinase
MDGLILSEANCGDLQSFLDQEDVDIDITARKNWSIQLAQALAYTHEKGIIHKNLSTTNVLLHKGDHAINVVLADFGASQWLELNIFGDLVPDDPYRDPYLKEFGSPRVDVFSLGITIYIIMTGHYPFHGRPAPENDDMFEYGKRVQNLYREGRFPDLSNVPFGNTIAGCCCERRFETAKDVVVALEKELLDPTATAGPPLRP